RPCRERRGRRQRVRGRGSRARAPQKQPHPHTHPPKKQKKQKQKKQKTQQQQPTTQHQPPPHHTHPTPTPPTPPPPPPPTPLTPLAGERAGLLFAIGLFGASVLAAAVLPLATSYTICGALGWERRLGTRFSDAHQFYSIIAFLVVMGAAITLLPVPLIPLIVGAQVLNGFLL